MSCCGGSCGCGSGCKRGHGCGGCKMYPDLTEKVTTTKSIIGFAPGKSSNVFEMEKVAENGGCNCCIPNCACDHCNCK